MAVIITTNVGCVGEVLRPGTDCIVVPIGDRNALVEAIETVMRDKESGGQMAKKMMANAYKSVRKHLM